MIYTKKYELNKFDLLTLVQAPKRFQGLMLNCILVVCSLSFLIAIKGASFDSQERFEDVSELNFYIENTIGEAVRYVYNDAKSLSQKYAFLKRKSAEELTLQRLPSHYKTFPTPKLCYPTTCPALQAQLDGFDRSIQREAFYNVIFNMAMCQCPKIQRDDSERLVAYVQQFIEYFAQNREARTNVKEKMIALGEAFVNIYYKDEPDVSLSWSVKANNAKKERLKQHKR